MTDGGLPAQFDVLPLQCLHDKVGYYPAVVRAHPWAVGVENADHLDVHAMLPVIIKKQCLRHPLSLVIAGKDAIRVHTAPISLRPGVYLRIPVNLAGAGLAPVYYENPLESNN